GGRAGARQPAVAGTAVPGARTSRPSAARGEALRSGALRADGAQGGTPRACGRGPSRRGDRPGAVVARWGLFAGLRIGAEPPPGRQRAVQGPGEGSRCGVALLLAGRPALDPAAVDPGPLRDDKVFGRAQPRKHLADPDRIGAGPRRAEFAVDERLGAPDKGHPRSLGELTRRLCHPRQGIGDNLLAREVRAGPHALIIPPYPLIYETLCA